MFEVLAEALQAALTVPNIAGVVIGLAIGVTLGATPGLSGTMAIALIVPLTYTWSPLFSIALLMGCWKGSIFGGSIGAILLNTPGTASAAATAIDGYPLAKKGQAGKALKIALIASVCGALFSDFLLIGAAPIVANFALMLGPPEYASIILFSLAVIATSGRTSPWGKGVIATLLGLMLSTVGLDPITGQRRFTFGILELDAGIPLLPMLIGLLVLSEILTQISKGWENPAESEESGSKNSDGNRVTLDDVRKVSSSIIRCSLIGSFCGALPGIGSVTAAYLGYSHNKSFYKGDRTFGNGDIRGIAAPEAANNAVCGAGLIPLVTLGIPGALTAAVILGAFLIHGLTPGPTLIAERPEFVYGLFVLLILSDMLLPVVALPIMALATRAMRISRIYLYPVILLLCVTGTYLTNQSVFDIKAMMFFGFVGYILRNAGVDLAALLIAFILGPMAETYLRQSLELSESNVLYLLDRPIVLGFVGLTVFLLLRSFTRSKSSTGTSAT